MNVIYVVVRIADVGETDVLTGFTDQSAADEFADWINQNESPGYTAYVDAIGVDFDAFTNDYKQRWDEATPAYKKPGVS